MRSVACWFLSSVLLLASKPVTVLVDFEHPHSETSFTAMRQELQNLLEPAGLTVDLKLKTELGDAPEFPELVIFKMKGTCSMEGTPMPIGALSDERGPLAMAFSSDGEILHFGEVECDRIRRCLERGLSRGETKNRQEIFGTALGIVIAHEMYHMMANEKAHTKHGLTKHSLSAQELLSGKLDMPAPAREAVKRSQPVLPQNSSVALR